MRLHRKRDRSVWRAEMLEPVLELGQQRPKRIVIDVGQNSEVGIEGRLVPALALSFGEEPQSLVGAPIVGGRLIGKRVLYAAGEGTQPACTVARLQSIALLHMVTGVLGSGIGLG